MGDALCGFEAVGGAVENAKGRWERISVRREARDLPRVERKISCSKEMRLGGVA